MKVHEALGMGEAILAEWAKIVSVPREGPLVYGCRFCGAESPVRGLIFPIAESFPHAQTCPVRIAAAVVRWNDERKEEGEQSANEAEDGLPWTRNLPEPTEQETVELLEWLGDVDWWLDS